MTHRFDVPQIRTQIKEIIAQVANLDPAEIGEGAHFIDELGLDSLSLLEIGVDVDYAFRLGVPEETLAELRTVNDTVDLVVRTLAGRTATAAAETAQNAEIAHAAA